MKFVEGHTVGIDLGTTFSSIARLDQRGDPRPIPNEEGGLETPSVVLFGDGDEVIVGPTRAQIAAADPDDVVERIKREMGNYDFRCTVRGKDYTPEFISALILKKLVQDASKKIGPIGNAVITVPYYFNDARRKATEDAGRIAGLNVVDVINEPTAATLLYAWTEGVLGGGKGGGAPRTALVYDLGGGTFDVTAIRYAENQFEVLATDGDVHLGGVDWTDRIADLVAEEFISEHGIDPRESRFTFSALRNEADYAKIRLSREQSVSITCRHEGKTTTVLVSRERMEEAAADLLQRTLDTTDLVLDMANLPGRKVEAIVLVGGSTLMPKVPEALRDLTGVEPFRGLSPHTAVAQGAAIHAAILEAKHRPSAQLPPAFRKRLQAIHQQDVNSHGLGIVIKDSSGKYRNHVMIQKNTKIPVVVKQTFHTAQPDQRRVTVRVVQGDAPDPDACSVLGKCTIHGFPVGLPKGSPIEVSYSYNDAGRVVVAAREPKSGVQAQIAIERSGGLSDAQVGDFGKAVGGLKVS